MIWSKLQLLKALSIEAPLLDNNHHYGSIKFNSQDIKPNDLFIALQGKRDGHLFVKDAFDRGASAAIVSKHIDDVKLDQLIFVDNTYSALHDLAIYKRNKSKAKFIGITGSSGKTSTRNSLHAILEGYGKVYSSPRGFNNHLGVPLTLASLPDDIDYAILELGMSSKGEIHSLAKQVRPDIAIITTVGSAHIECFNSIYEICDAKCEIFDYIDSIDGKAVINRDMSVYNHCMSNVSKVLSKDNIWTFGKYPSSRIKLIKYETVNNSHTKLQYCINNEYIKINIPKIIPHHIAENFGASFAVIDILHLDIQIAAKRIENIPLTKGRCNLETIEKNNKKYRIICDYYNSNPQSLRAGLIYLSNIESKNKVAILGDMLCLGDKSIGLHNQMIPYIIASEASKVIFIGDIMYTLMDKLPKNISTEHYKTYQEALIDLDKHIKNDDLIFIKGSRAMQLDKIAEYLGVNNAL